MNRCLAALLAVGVVSAAAHGGGGSVRFVDDDAAPGGDGLAWNTSYQFLQDALAEADMPGSGVTEIRVAQGAYLPDHSAANPAGTADRMTAFVLRDDLTINGGYAGIGEPDPDVRDVDLYITVLTGDLAGDDVGTLNNAENSIHVLTATDLSNTAILDGVTVQGGHADEFSDKGTAAGGLLLLNSNALVQNCRFLFNVAQDTGGAVAVSQGAPTFTDCDFEQNEGEFGGAVLNFEGDPSFTGCTFDMNMAVQLGGGVYNLAGNSVSMENCSFTGNTAGTNGGGLLNDSATSPTFTGCTFDGNAVILSSGGGVHNLSSSPTFDTCTFTNNTGVFGGGMSNAISSNSVLTNCDFESNEASWGGGIANYGFLNGSPGAGSSPTITDCTFTANNATTTGGGIASDVDSNPEITRGTFTKNTATSAGGAIGLTLRSDAVIDDCTFTGNSAAFGGALSCNLDCSPSVTNSTFENNHASSEGGAFHVQDSDPTFDGCMILSNSAGELGGAVYSRRSMLSIIGCTIDDNSAMFGGALATFELGAESVVRSTLSNNNASESGGAVFSQGSAMTLVNCNVFGNTADVDGGAVTSSASEFAAINCTLSGNTAAQKGGAVFVSIGAVTFTNCTVSSNVADMDGGGFYTVELGMLNITNSIVWGNTDLLGQIEDSQLRGWPAVVNYSCVQGWTGLLGGAGNIGLDPMLTDADGADDTPGTADDDVRLLADSPCIDAADNLALPIDDYDLDDDEDLREVIPLDQDDLARKVEDPDTVDTGSGDAPIVDMGAFEFPAESKKEECPPDLNDDGIIGPGDLAIILGNWGPVPPNDPLADLTEDGVVGPADLAIILGNWGPCP